VRPVIEELAAMYAERMKVDKVNTDANQAIHRRYGIHSIPTVALFKQGKIVGQIVGELPKSEFTRMIDALL
jgi:thioredoxin 1